MLFESVMRHILDIQLCHLLNLNNNDKIVQHVYMV